METLQINCPKCSAKCEINDTYIVNKFNRYISGEQKKSFSFHCKKCGEVSKIENWIEKNLQSLPESHSVSKTLCRDCSKEILQETYDENNGLCNDCKLKIENKKDKKEVSAGTYFMDNFVRWLLIFLALALIGFLSTIFKK